MVFPDFAGAVAEDFKLTVTREASSIFEEDPVLSTLGAEDVGTVEVKTDVDQDDAFSDKPIESEARPKSLAKLVVSILAPALVAVAILSA